MKKKLFNYLTSGVAVVALAFAGETQTARSATVSWIGVAGTSTTTNWSDSANWSGGGPNQNAVQFGGTGSATTAGTVTSVMDTVNGNTNHPVSMLYSNVSSATPAQYHTTLIADGLTVTNDTTLTVGGWNNIGGQVTSVSIVGNGTLVQNGNITIGNNGGSSGSSAQHSLLDLSGLSNFVVNASSSTIQMSSGNRSSAAFNLAAISNNITIGTWNANTLSSSSSGSDNLTLGAGTNILNIGAYNSALQRNSCTMQFPAGSSAGLRLRGVLGTDASRCTMVLGDRTANGSSGTSTGGLNLTNNPVDIKLSTLTIGQAANVGSLNVGIGNIVFDTGTMDATTIAMGINAGPATAIGNITVGSNSVAGVGGTLIIGNGGFSMVNASSNGVTDGGLSILGGTVICSNNIFKTMHLNFSGYASITNYGGTLNMLSGTIGGMTNSIDFMTCSNSTLVLAGVDYGLTNVTVGNFDTENGGDTALLNTISVGLLPGITSFPAYFHMILYTNGTAGITGAGADFVATGISGVYTYYVTNYTATVNGITVGFVDLAVTAGPVAKAITWNGTPTANWNTTDLDWLTGGNPTNFNQGDYVTFDDTASGSTTVNLPSTVQPSTMTVNNTANAYTFTGAGRIAGQSTLVKQGANTLLFDNSGNNTFSGAITISAGTVQLGNADTSGNLGPGTLANNAALIVDRTDTPSLPNIMSGGGGLTNSGAGSVLTVSGANSSYTGAVMVAQGTLKMGNNLALGTTNNGITIANGATLDLNGFSATNIPVTVIGAGVGSAGAIINSSTISVNPGVTHVILAGNATFGGVGRWDLRLTGAGGTDPSLSTLSTLGQPYNLTKTGTNFVSISSVTVDPALANIDIQGGTLSFENNTTSMGNPANSLTVEAGATLELYSPTNLENKAFVLNGNGTNSTLIEGNGTATVIGPVTLNGSNIWSVAGTSLNVSGPISGSGSLKEIGGNSLILSGNNTYTSTTTVTNGTLALNGINSGLPGQIIIMTNTTLVGTGTNAGAVTIGGRLNPGNVSVAGTLTVGALTLSSGATATFDLNPTTTVGGGVNDFLQVNGNLTLNNNTITINLLQGTLAAGTYQLINYTGTLSGSFNPTVVLSTGGATRYGLTLNTSTPGQINLVVSGSAANVKWDGSTDNTWDVGTTPNWLNLGTSAMDNFYQGDTILLDDTVGVLTGLNLTNAAAPLVITNNSSVNNFSITGPGRITGAASIVKEGSSTLLLGTANDFNGTVTVLAGTLQVTNNASLGSTNGPTIIASGATLDVMGLPANNVLNLGLEPIIVSGSGVGGEGAIINSGPNPQEDATRLITLAGDTTFGGPGQFIIGNGTSAGRWDMRGTGTTLSTGGHPYNLTKVGNNQVSLVGVQVDTSLANIDIQQGMLGFEQNTTSMGNPAANLTVEPGANLELFTGSGTNYYTKQFIINGDGASTNIDNASGLATLNGAMTLNNGCVIYATSGTTLSNNCVVGGSGSLTIAGAGTVILTATDTYTGSTTIASGTLQLAGTATIANSPSMNLTGVNSTLNVNVRADQTFTLASGQSLTGIGTVAGNVTAGANTTIIPGNVNSNILAITGNLTLNGSSNSFVLNTPLGGDSELVVNSNLTLSGVNQLGISSQSQDFVGNTHTIIQYSGTLTGGAANLNVTGLGGFSYSLVDPSTTPGSIQVKVTGVPANFIWRGGVLGSETLWDTVHTNWYDPNLGNTTNFMSGVLAQFDDQSVYTNINLVGALDPLSMDFQNSTAIYTLLGSGSLTGNGGLTMDSSGTLIIANTGSNNFAGDINILVGGTLQIGNGGTSGNIGVANVINVTNNGAVGGLVFDRSDNINIANTINGPGSLTNSGTGVLTLSGNNTISGPITVGQGTLQVNNNLALGGTRIQQGTLVVSPGATLDLGGQSFAAQAENLSNEVVVVSGSGVGGEGAIINSSTNSQFNALRNVMVVGDLYLGGPGYWLATNASNPGRWDIRGSITNSALVTSNLQPYSLYKIGSNHVGLVGVTIDNTPGQSLGNIYIRGGKLQIESGTTSLGDVNSNLVISAGATLGFYQSSFTNNFTKQFVLNGNGSIVTISNENGTTTLNGTMDLEGGCIFGIGGTVITNNCSLSGGGSLIMNGAARLVLSNASIAYTGNTTISNGTLQLIGAIPPSPLFDIAGSGAVLDVSGAGGLLNLVSGQTISGGGTLRGSLTATSGSTVAPGEPGIIGKLAVTNAVILGSTSSTTMKVNRTGAATNDVLTAGATMSLGGTLNVTLLGGTLHAGDTFKLFTAGGGLSGTFSATNLPALPSGLGWVTTNLVNGIISVVATVNTNPTNITANVSGNMLTLSWPVDHTGWRLLAQTNSLSTGLNPSNSAWTFVTGSSATNSVNITVDPGNGTVFYKLVYP